MRLAVLQPGLCAWHVSQHMCNGTTTHADTQHEPYGACVALRGTRRRLSVTKASLLLVLSLAGWLAGWLAGGRAGGL